MELALACVKLFHQAGSKVAFTYKHGKSEAEKLVSQFKENMVLPLKVDMESESEINDCVAKVVKEFGKN